MKQFGRIRTAACRRTNHRSGTRRRKRVARSTGGIVLAVLVAGLAGRAAARQAITGADIYQQQCTRCHGPAGQGTNQNIAPLAGGMNVAELEQLIRETMPEDEPGSLSAEQAREVARFVHMAFYSTPAANDAPPRIELSRLSVPQYRRTILDLFDSFVDTSLPADVQPGLTGEYFEAREPRKVAQRKLQRIDPRIEFDFGTEPPVAEVTDPRRFAIRWSGSVLAPDTGIYTFAVHSQHAIRFWLNSATPRIDAWVKSAGDDEHQVDLFLVGGVQYPLVLEFSKSKQGVDDSDKQQEKPPVQPATLSLKWKRPHGVLQTIPGRYLAPVQAPVHTVCATPFPPDDRSYGWIRTSTVSREWDRATTAAALEVTAHVMARLDSLRPADSAGADQTASLQQFCLDVMERAFRGPVTSDDNQRVEAVFEQSSEPRQAVQRLLLYTLKSPRFLFREIHDCEACNVASRLSFGLWDSLPDTRLHDAALSGALAASEQIRHQARRMLTDPRATWKLRRALLSWLQIDGGHELHKDPDRFPGFDAAAIADMRESLELLIDEVVGSDTADYRHLLTSDEVWLNRRLARLFDVADVETDGFAKFRLEPEFRSGVLTHPYLLARFAYRSESSPIHRGVFVARHVLGTRFARPLRRLRHWLPNCTPI